jgi:hypothetical protein
MVNVFWRPREKGAEDFYCRQEGVNYTGDDDGWMGYLVWDDQSQAWLRVVGCFNCRGEAAFESWLPEASARALAAELLPQARGAAAPKCP